MTAVITGKNVSVYEMLRMIGRAGLATDSGDAAKLTMYLRGLNPDQLVEEFHRSVVILAERNLLTKREQRELAEYATSWVAEQPMAG